MFRSYPKAKAFASMNIFSVYNSKISRAECPVAKIILLAKIVSPFWVTIPELHYFLQYPSLEFRTVPALHIR
jgi:hypothetical protein